MPQIALIGAGVSGLACAVSLADRGIDCAAYDAGGEAGGHARTDRVGEFRFDHGPHVLLDIPAAVRPLFERLDLRLRRCTCQSTIYYHRFGRRHIPAPLQLNLAQLPVSVRLRCIGEFGVERLFRRRAVVSHGDASRQALGRGVVDVFLEPYGRKRLTFALDDIDAAWTDRVPRPALSDVLWRGLFSREVRAGLDTSFQYPEQGGIEELPRALARLLPPGTLELNAEVVEVDLAQHRLTFASGRHAHFEAVVSSIPLPTLLGLIRQVPEHVGAASRELEYGSTYVVNTGWDGPLAGPHGIIRYPEPDIAFYRLSFPGVYAAGAVPAGKDAAVAEVGYHPVRRPRTPGEAADAVRADLRRIGIVAPGTTQLEEQVLPVPISHVIHNRRTVEALKTITSWLHEAGVYTSGKYGEWRELLMPQSMLSGMRAAERVAAHVGAARHVPAFAEHP